MSESDRESPLDEKPSEFLASIGNTGGPSAIPNSGLILGRDR